MTYTPPAVIDADAHVIESNLTWEYLEPSEEKYRPKIVVENGNPNVKKWDVNGEIRAFVVETVEAPDGIGTTAGKSDRNVGTPARGPPAQGYRRPPETHGCARYRHPDPA